MTINFTMLQSLTTGLNELASKELPFKLSLIIAKNLSLLEKEQEFYLNQEREFAFKYLEMKDGQFVQDLHDFRLEWRGSSNQRVIDIPATRQKGEIVLFCD